MITFPDSHVDLMGNNPFTPAQVADRWDRELLRKWTQTTQNNLRDFMQIKSAVNPETFPNYAQNEALLAEFITDKQECYTKRVADEAKAVLLDQVLAYEKAVRDVEQLTLVLNGRDEVLEIPEQTDPETGEMTQAYVPGMPAIEPMVQFYIVGGEEVEGPVYAEIAAELADAQAVIESSSEAVLEQVAARAEA